MQESRGMEMTESEGVARNAKGNGSPEPTVAFDYIKSPGFKVIRADGAIGAVTPNGHIHMALFSERQAIPRRIVNSLALDGTIGGQIDSQTESRNSIVREMDVDVFLSVDAAELLRNWLDQRINEAKSRMTPATGLKQ